MHGKPLVLALALLTAGCGLTETGLDQEFDLSPGQTAVLADARLAITFVSVPEDSRCPSDVTCVWQGNARIGVEASVEGGTAEPLEINTGFPPAEADFAGYVIEVTKVLPTPVSTQSIDPLEYRVTFRVRHR